MKRAVGRSRKGDGDAGQIHSEWMQSTKSRPMLESMEHHDGINVSVFVGASVNAADFPGC